MMLQCIGFLAGLVATSRIHIRGYERVKGTQQSASALLSLARPATGSVRGNLGPPSVVTSEVMDNWLQDRWQAASDMNGTPIPGEHWIVVDLQRPCLVSSLLLDWEVAFCNRFSILTDGKDKEWVESKFTKTERKSDKHVIHLVKLTKPVQATRVKLLMTGRATQWGISLWRMQILGWEIGEKVNTREAPQAPMGITQVVELLATILRREKFESVFIEQGLNAQALSKGKITEDKLRDLGVKGVKYRQKLACACGIISTRFSEGRVTTEADINNSCEAR